MNVLRCLAIATVVAAAPAFAADTMYFEVDVKKDGRVVDKPSFLASLGQPVTIRFGDGRAFEAATRPAGEAGQYWSQIRITLFETDSSRMVHEMSMLHDADGGSFEYTDPAQRRYFVKVRKVDR